MVLCVFATILLLAPQGSTCSTCAGVNCHLHRRDAKMDEPQSLEQVLQKGWEIQARVIDIDYTNGGRLILVSKSEELAKHEYWEREYLCADEFYYVVDKDERMRIEKEKRVCNVAAFNTDAHQCPLMTS